MAEVQKDANGDKIPQSRQPSSTDPSRAAQTGTQEENLVTHEETQEERMKALEEFQKRPDIESRESILARENAYPGQFSNENVATGDVTDGKAVTSDGTVKSTKEAKKEAASVKDLTAKE